MKRKEFAKFDQAEELCRQEFLLIAMLAYLFGIDAELRYCVTDDEDCDGIPLRNQKNVI